MMMAHDKKRLLPRVQVKNFMRYLASVNWVLVACMLLLLVIGVFYINSANAVRSGAVRWQHVQQYQRWIPLGLFLHIVVARLPYRRLADWSILPYLATLALLVAVLAFGTARFGARRWLFGFQPSEFAKFAAIPALAFVLTRTTIVRGWVRLLAASVVALVPTILIAAQPDLGTAIVLVSVTAVMLFVSGCAPRTLTVLATTSVLGAGLFLGVILGPELIPMSPQTHDRIERVTDKFIRPHWRKRVISFAFPDRDPLGAGWNKRQSEIAVGSGGAWGKGYLNGTQNILGFLPQSVSSTDFIFSVIAEEAGYYGGSLLLLLLYAGLLGAIGTTAFLCRDSTGRLVCVGVGTLLFTHIFVNIAMTVGRVPITGLPLPLISYGGSFTISTMAMLGLVQSVAIHGRRPEHSR